MKPSNFEQFQTFIESDSFKWYNEQLEDMAREYENLADQPGLDTENRLWYLAKVRGIRECIDSPKLWLNNIARNDN